MGLPLMADAVTGPTIHNPVNPVIVSKKHLSVFLCRSVKIYF